MHGYRAVDITGTMSREAWDITHNADKLISTFLKYIKAKRKEFTFNC